MILIADSGSTKTDWVLIDERNNQQLYSSVGLNPYFVSSDVITKELKNTFLDTTTNSLIRLIYFYGAGCSADLQKEIIKQGLKPVFPNAVIIVNSDLLGAARALFHEDKGIAVILGTGASTCLYDGDQIIQSVKSLGYIFGDEGGGDHIGKLFISGILNDSMPDEIRQKFSEKFNLSKDQILRKVYSEPFPNNFLASFCEFIAENKTNPEIELIILQSFRLLFENYIKKYPDYQKLTIRITGSIAHYFNKELKQVAREYNCNIDLIKQKPLSGLVDFHKNYNTIK